MVTDTPVRTEPTCWYTPSKVRWCLEHWRELQELAYPTQQAIRYDRVGQPPKGYKPADGLHWLDVCLDIEREWPRLGNRWSLPFLLVEKCMQGYALAAIAQEWDLRFARVYGEFLAVSEALARRLGWDGDQTRD